MNKDLIYKVESLKAILVTRATSQDGDDMEYRNLRQDLIAIPHIKSNLPTVVNVCRNLAEFWGFIQPKFSKYTERREYLRKEFEDLLHMLEIDATSPSDSVISETIKLAGFSYIDEAWQKALERRSIDPEGAITAARTLLESVCKHVLDSVSCAYDDTADLPKLYSLTAKQLNLSPSQHSEQLFKQILGGCQTVVEGLGAMRNRHSDAHGKGMSGFKPSSRHAQLAVNLSGAMAMFLLQTWEERKK